jgi:hypothetical protein
VTVLAGGCLCGQLRWESRGEPLYQGHCYCEDCRKASGSGFVPFMGFRAEDLSFQGRSLAFGSPAANGAEAVRNSCPRCGGLVFGGIVGVDAQHTIYAGSLDDPTRFHPTMAIFTRGAPDWAAIPAGLTRFERAPG